jgi:hypothetical protein
MAMTIAALGTFLTTSVVARATPGEILVITGEDVALRAAPGPKSKVIEHLDKNDRIMEFERRDGWVRGMLFGAIGKEGWVAARYLRSEIDDAEDRPPEPADRTLPDAAAERTQPSDEGGAYVTRSRERVYLHCLDCGLPRRHETRRRHDRPHSEVWQVPRRRTHDRKPPPVIRVLPTPAPVWGGDPRN